METKVLEVIPQGCVLGPMLFTLLTSILPGLRGFEKKTTKDKSERVFLFTRNRGI